MGKFVTPVIELKKIQRAQVAAEIPAFLSEFHSQLFGSDQYEYYTAAKKIEDSKITSVWAY